MPSKGIAQAAAGLVLALGAWPLQALAAVEAPSFKVGDHWVYQETTTKGQAGFQQVMVDVSVTRVADKYIEIAFKQPDSPGPVVTQMIGADWSRERSINGALVTVNKPLSFPLAEGKTWDINYTEPNPAKLVKSQTFHRHYKVAGWEDVQTPAGTYRALKVECDGEWTKETEAAHVAGSVIEHDSTGASGGLVNRAVPGTISSGRLYTVVWYAPEVKRFVKSTEEYYSSTGVRSESHTALLESFKPAG
jgi:hypothetical protein